MSESSVFNVRPPHGSASCACLFCWNDIATLTADLAAERAEVERLTEQIERFRAEVDRLDGALWKIRSISFLEARRER